MARYRKSITPEDLVDIGVRATDAVVGWAIDALKRDAPSYLVRHLAKPTGKEALRVDLDAEDTYEEALHTDRGRAFADILLFGEERLSNPKLDLTAEPGIVALVDAVDGTDLLERNLGNWCCASLFFQPSRPAGSRILAAVVGLPSRTTYYALATSSEVHVMRKRDGRPERVHGTSGVESLAAASLYFYGQKAKNLRDTVSILSPLLEEPRTDLRIYTLAGIPMLVRLIDHAVPSARGIDVVFDLMGQQPHDAIPGLFIAKKAGASVVDLNGRDITWEAMEEALLRPASGRIKYVAASTPKLAHEFLAALKPRSTPRNRKVPVQSGLFGT